MNKTVKYLLISTIIMALSACTGGPVLRQQEDSTALLTERAEQALEKANSSIASQQPRHQITAAQLFVKAGDNKRALAALNNLDSNQLDDIALVEYSLFHIDLAFQEDNFFLARRLLSNRRMLKLQPTMNLEQQKKWLLFSGDLFALLGEDLKSINAYIALSKLANDIQERVTTHDKLWRVLSHLPQKNLDELQKKTTDVDLKGWFSLANISRETQADVRQQLEYIDLWRSNWPAHPAATALPSGLNAVKNIVNDLPKRIAILLPMQGSLAEAGASIRDGFLAAWYDNNQQSANTPSTRFYDTSGNTPVIEVYQQAVSEGAELIIGPLQKANVQELFALPVLPVPTIALNYVDNPTITTPQNLFQFGLSSTDEARQIADRAWIEGQRTALALTPKSNWGERVLETFRAHWEAKGGKLYVAEPYGKQVVDFAPLLKPSLHINHSEQRANRLQRTLGKKLNYTTRRRQDLDMVFMAAYPDAARQIKPTLDFLFARDLQVYGTSQLFSGENNPGRNRDLEGIRFSAMPWTLPGATPEKLQPDADLRPLYRHMFALGIDTYHLHQWLAQMVNQPGTQLFGSTGTLQLSQNNTITREQPWAEFRQGQVLSAQRLTETDH